MNTLKFGATIGIVVALATPLTSQANDARSNSAHGVFVMTNDARHNEVLAYERTAFGTLQDAHRYATEGRGSGGKVDPLASQGSLTLSEDQRWLFAVNAGSGTVTAFRVDGSRLQYSDRISTDGSEPNSVTQHGNLVYVLNTAGSSSVVGFYFEDGKFVRIRDSVGFLSANTTASGSVAFSPDGKFLVVTEKATNSIDVFRVLEDGTLSPITNSKDVGAGTFSALVADHGVAVVTETGPAAPGGGAAPDASALSTYAIQRDGSLKVISKSIPTLGTAACWDVITNNGRYVYVSNSASSTIAGFSIDSRGALTALPNTIVAALAPGSTNLDIAASADSQYLYTLNAANGSISEFKINAKTGALSALGTVEGLPASQGINGIAAN